MNDHDKTIKQAGAAVLITGCITLFVYASLIIGGLVGAIYLLSHW